MFETSPDNPQVIGGPSSISCHVGSHRKGFLSYPMDDELQYGVRLTAIGSGTLPPIALTQKVPQG